MTTKDTKSAKDRRLFAFRAETTRDVWSFLVRLYEMEDPVWVKDLSLSHYAERCTDARVELRVLKINPKGGPGQPYHIPAKLSELGRAAIVDCHVIVESLDYAEQSTGGRYYLPWKKAHAKCKTFKIPNMEVKSFCVR